MSTLTKSTCEIDLYFVGQTRPALQSVVFVNSENERRDSVRGKAKQRRPDQFTFELSTGVRAMGLLFIRHATSEGAADDCCLQGATGSPASSLDQAISKNTGWIGGIFGPHKKRNSYLHHLVVRHNSGQKQDAEPVRLTVRSSVLPPEKTRVFVDGRPITSRAELLRFYKLLHETWSMQSGQGGRRSPSRCGSVGLFGVALRTINGKMRILLNVRNDQAVQKKNANIAADARVKIVDLPGGTWRAADETEETGLIREVKEETGVRPQSFRNHLDHS